MTTLGRILRAALEGFFRLADALGARGGRWEWRKQHWRRALEERIASWENVERGVRAPTRMCPECRTLVPRTLASCPACGASMRGVPGGGPRRLLAAVLPAGFGSVSAVLITANVLLSLVILITWGAKGPGASGPMGILSPPWQALYVFGEKYPAGIFAGEVWRLVTANYLHGGLLHLAFNCYALAILGPLVEEAFGGRKLFLIYTTCGVAAFSLSTLVSRAPSVGASGAIFGLMGFGIVYGRFRGGPAGRRVAQHLLQWAIYGVVMLLWPGIDNAAHFGGFLAGAALGLWVPAGAPRSRAGEVGLNALAAAALLATLGSFAMVALRYAENVEMLRRSGMLPG